MKIRRYIGKTNQEALNKLKRELGTNAVILHTRKIKRPGVFGFLKRPLVEVVAAVDKGDNNEEHSKKVLINNHKLYNSNEENNNYEKLSNNKSFSIDTEIMRIRELIENVINKVDSNGYSSLPIELIKYKEKLVSNGVEESIAYNILNSINTRINVKEKSPEKIHEIVKHSIIYCLGEPLPIKLDGRQKVVFFIGPTGVGKTTTLAKIAASFVLHNKNKVGLITSDTYRIAAVEQLKTYSEILNIPIKIIYETEEIYSALSKLNDKELILIDTAGRSHKDRKQLEELKELIFSINNKEVFLVLSASTSWNTLKSIIEQYNFIEDYKIIFTKLDESDSLGVILNTGYYTKKPISYFTNGQNVPDDIEIPDIKKLSKQLIGEF